MPHVIQDQVRHRTTLALCAFVGLAAALSLQFALEFRASLDFPKSGATRISVKVGVATPPRASAPSRAVDSKERLPLKTEKAVAEKPRHFEPSQSQPAVEQVKEKALPVQEPAEAPVTALPVLPTLEQPQLQGATTAMSAAVLPPMIGQGSPMPGAEHPVPNFVLTSTEKPGGDILVLGVLIDDQGHVEDTRIAVPSRFALGDISMALGYLRQRWTQLDPPMMPGERRWLELRIDHAAQDPSRGVIP